MGGLAALPSPERFMDETLWSRRLDGLSFDNARERVETLKRLFPEAVKEDRFDPDILFALLEDGDYVHALNDERYDFTWSGKRESLKLAQRRSQGTLRPDMEQSRDWETTGNLYIEGDNLEVMKLLQQGYLRKVKMIYIDPPYNTGQDFVYQDDFADPIAKYKEATGQGMRANPETAGRYHSNWLSMMYPRLKIAKTLLRDDGVIFISIDDNEVHNLRRLCDDVFGEENFVAELIWEGANKNDARQIGIAHEYVVVYARQRYDLPNEWNLKKEGVESALNEVGRLSQLHGEDYKAASADLAGWFRAMKNTPSFGLRRFRNIDRRGAYKEDDPTAPGGRRFDLISPRTGQVIPLRRNRGWSFDQTEFERLVNEGRITFVSETSIMVRRYLHETDTVTPPSVFYQPARSASERLGRLMEGNYFDFPKDETVIAKFVEMATDPTDADCIVMDFFSGSGTTAHAVMQLNAEDGGRRQFLCIQIPEPTPENSEARKGAYATIADIGRERIRRAGDKILSAWQEGKREGGTSLFDGAAEAPAAPDVGFRVFRLDSSNWIPWDDRYIPDETPDLFLKRLEASLDNVKHDRGDLDFLYEVFLKYGIPLTAPLERVEVRGKTFYRGGENGFIIICLDKDLDVETVEETAERYVTGAFLFADQCFTSINELTNASLSLERIGIEFRWI